MRIVKSFQYFQETKREVSHLVILDSEGDVWIRYDPLDPGTHWRKVALPSDFFDDEEECADAISC